ncbi:MAG: OstA-like protein [Bacteroidales bacterium]|nr:OstA-like protein [Bacteroidales bacterium]
MKMRHQNPHSNRHKIPLLGFLCLMCICFLSAENRSYLHPYPSGFGKAVWQDTVKSVLAETTVRPNRPANPKSGNKTRIDLLFAENAKSDQLSLPDVEVLVGNVRLRHDSMYMFCDSALIFKVKNSVEAFGNVHMEQGDTLFIDGDYLYYDGTTQMAQLRENVKLINKTTELTTDSLNYDRVMDLGYYFDGGVLVDSDNVLTSEWGEYSPSTKIAVFNHDVKLVNPKFTLSSDTLKYNTETKIATILGPSLIDSEDDHIYSERGSYNTQTSIAYFLNRSILANEGRRIIADSIYFNRAEEYGEAFDNVIMTDTVNMNMMMGDYCYYNDREGTAMGTKNAVAVDYSQGDSLFVHGDSLWLHTYDIHTDSVWRVIQAYHHVRAYRTDVQAVSDSMVYISKDSCLTMYAEPVIWYGNQQILGEEIKVFFNDSTIERAQVINQALAIDRFDTLHYNQISGREMTAFFQDGEVYRVDVNGNVMVIYYPIDDKDSTIIGLDYSEGSFLRMKVRERKMERGAFIGKANGVMYPLEQVPADRKHLPSFVWLDYIRPKDKNDIFVWREKKAGEHLQKSDRKPVASPRNMNIKRNSKK